MELKKLAGINKDELSLIEVAHAILEENGDIIDFTELLIAIQNYLGLDESKLEERMIRFYTDINIDGRFISLGDNRWGLRVWYAINEIDEEIITSAEEEEVKRKPKKKRKLNAFADSEDMIDYNDDDPEDSDEAYEEDDDVFDDDEDDDEEDDTASLTTIIEPDAEEEEDEKDKELVAYKSDLSELGDDDIEIVEEDADFDEFDDEEIDDLEDDEVEENEEDEDE